LHKLFGYRCATEEYPSSVLVERAVKAEQNGFDFLCASDHFHPWFHREGHACHPWILLSSIGAGTKRIRIGTSVTAPIYRYHPAIIAQAFATLGELYPNRVFLGLGIGEAMNEAPLGFNWPDFETRMEILKEAVDVIRQLWKNKFVDYNGKHLKLRKAKLYVQSRGDIPLYVAAEGLKSARQAGRIGDGFMTFTTKPTEQSISKLKKVLDALREGTEEAERAFEGFPKMVELLVSYDEDYEKALHALAKWRILALPNKLHLKIYDPRELDKLAENVNMKDLEEVFLIATNVEQCIKFAEQMIKLGFNEIQFHSASPNEDGFISKFGRKALPYLKATHSSTG
jgi:coenzyme F420-dependent glucose-6-phosphate dehydrogenase